MSGRHWLRRDVLMPILYLAVLGVGLYWLFGKLEDLPVTADAPLVIWIIRSMVIIYLLLLVITGRHILSTYDLERYDPGNMASLRRLMRRGRYRLRKKAYPADRLLVRLEQCLLHTGYRLESESHLIGRIYIRRNPLGFLPGRRYDRVIIMQHEPLNVLMIDQILQDAIRYIRSQRDLASRRNILLLVTRMQESEEVASCGAGVVNFLGQFRGGTLGVVLLATQQHRLFYPADRTLLPRLHRWHHDRFRRRIKSIIRDLQHNDGTKKNPDRPIARTDDPELQA
jgi:hypothetical protein